MSSTPTYSRMRKEGHLRTDAYGQRYTSATYGTEEALASVFDEEARRIAHAARGKAAEMSASAGTGGEIAKLQQRARRHEEVARDLRTGKYGVIDSFCKMYKVWVGSSLAEDDVRAANAK